jgi:hemerythrin-like domain-containing protein
MIIHDTLPNLALDLQRIHRVISRGLEVSVQEGKIFATNGFPDSSTRRGFLDYVKSLVTILDAHHNSEDELAFPYFREILPHAPYQQLSADHKQMEKLLCDISANLEHLQNTEEREPLPSLVDLLKGLTILWNRHIAIEEEHFGEQALSPIIPPEEQGRLSGELARHSQAKAGPPFLIIPFILYNLDQAERAAVARNMPAELIETKVPGEWRELWAPMMPFLLDQ